MEIWTAGPEDMNVNYQIGQNHHHDLVTQKHFFSDGITFEVSDSNNDPIDEAHICLMNDTLGLYKEGDTRPNGLLHIDILPQIPDGHANITATKHNYIPLLDSVVIDQSPPYSLLGFDGTDPCYPVEIDGDEWISDNTHIGFWTQDWGNPPSGVDYVKFRFYIGDAWTGYYTWDPSDPNVWISLSTLNPPLTQLQLLSLQGEPLLIEYFSVDNVYNIEDPKSYTVYVDSTPPTTTFFAKFSQNPGITVWLNATDDFSDESPGVGAEDVNFIISEFMGYSSGPQIQPADVEFTQELSMGMLGFLALGTVDFHTVDRLGNTEATHKVIFIAVNVNFVAPSVVWMQLY
jgi:hypothetical protein